MSSVTALSPERHDVANAIAVFFAAIKKPSSSPLVDLILPGGHAIYLDDSAADSAQKTTLSSLSAWAENVTASRDLNAPEPKETDTEIRIDGALAAAWVPVKYPVSTAISKQVFKKGVFIITLAKVDEKWIVSGVTEKKDGHGQVPESQLKQKTSEAEALQVLNDFIKEMSLQNAEAMLLNVIDEGGVTLLRDGVVHTTLEGMVRRMETNFFGKGLYFEERCHDVVVRVEGRLCLIWSPFEIWLRNIKEGDQMTKSADGSNAVTFLQVDERWLMAGVADVNRGQQ